MIVVQLIGFPFFESQAIWIAQLLSGKRTLPSCDDMMQSIKEFYHSKDTAGIPKHNTHDLAEFEVLKFFMVLFPTSLQPSIEIIIKFVKHSSI